MKPETIDSREDLEHLTQQAMAELFRSDVMNASHTDTAFNTFSEKLGEFLGLAYVLGKTHQGLIMNGLAIEKRNQS
jgi:hypothetical protein